jgi:Transcriptional Coactivator p15 (PC4)
MTDLFFQRDALSRPALKDLIGVMAKLSQGQRNEVARFGRKARAAKVPRIRRLTWRAVAEARRLAKEARTMSARRPTLPEPVEIATFWKNRGRVESFHVSLSEYEGHALINVRIYATGTDGIDRPTQKGVAMGVRKLPELAQALVKAEAQARSLGLLDDEAAS